MEERNINKKEWVDKLVVIDQLIDMGQGHDTSVEDQCHLTKLLLDLQRKESMNLAQKAKVKWAIERDENSKYFHEIINKKRHHNAIRGILVDGDWVDDPMRVKQEFYNHFASRFYTLDWNRPIIDMQFPNRLTFDQAGILEEDITRDEVRKAVWECGSEKAPGPNGFTFEFFKKFRNLLGDDVFAAVSEFVSSGTVPRGCNSSFITLIPKVLDPKLFDR